MIPTLCFSKNRAAQLDLLLQSVRKWAPWLEDSLTVLYKASPAHVLSYQYVRQDWPFVTFTAETDLEVQVREWLAQVQGPFMWLTDDSCFYRRADPAPETPWAYRTSGMYEWRKAAPGSEEAYPLTIVGTVYEKDTILPLLDYSFPNTTALEAGLATRADKFRPTVIFGGVQSLCLFDWNRVSEASGMPHANLHEDGFLTRYLAGERLDLEGMDFSEITTCHTIRPLPLWKESGDMWNKRRKEAQMPDETTTEAPVEEQTTPTTPYEPEQETAPAALPEGHEQVEVNGRTLVKHPDGWLYDDEGNRYDENGAVFS